ncbi:MAG: polyprenyl synthetase family protein [Planctomycetota bacterium]
MILDELYHPIQDELDAVENTLKASLSESSSESVLEMSDSVLACVGKRLRPALVILSAKVSENKADTESERDELIRIAAAFELIHIASLIHDDLVDHAAIRHNRPTVNSRWGRDVSVIFGDYVYSKAFELIAERRNPDIFSCICQAVLVMCQGELNQLCQRDNIQLSRDSYIVIVKKKTASIFTACCQAGTIISKQTGVVQKALMEFGHDFGMAFQVADDYKDITGKGIGKPAGQDIAVGEMTLPLMNLLDTVSSEDKKRLETLLASQPDAETVRYIRELFLDSPARAKTRQIITYYVESAKKKLNHLGYCPYKQSLRRLADYVVESIA